MENVSLFQHGRECPVPYAKSKACFEILSPEGGDGEVFLNGKKVTLRDSDFLIIAPGIYTELKKISEEARFFSLCFSEELAKWVLDEAALDFSFKLLPKTELSEVLSLSDLTESTMKEKNPSARAVLISCGVLKILGAGIKSGIFSYEERALASAKLREYVSANYLTYGEEETAERFSVSYSYFSRSFKSAVEMSFTDYVNFLRINEAKRLLFETETDLSTISRRLGFSSPSHFVNVFKRKTGETPKKFKNITRARAEEAVCPERTDYE